MEPLTPGPRLVGRTVRHAARPEWGAGRVLSVQRVRAEPPQWRVRVQFAVGTRALLVPPARLIDPKPEPQRAAGWIERLGGLSLDDRLARLPAWVEQALGLRERLEALLALYRYDASAASLIEWARRQADVADPLSHWTRDELAAQFERFAAERDAALRAAVAKARMAGQESLLTTLLGQLDPPQRRRAEEALSKVL